MKVSELIKELSKHNGNMNVFIENGTTDFKHDLLNEVLSEDIGFSEEDNSESLATDYVVVLKVA